MEYVIVKYAGPFGFIKPWTAVRDEETFSQQFLTPSIVEGMEKKLFPELVKQPGLQGRIIGHRLNYAGISIQQEQTWSKAWVEKSGEPILEMRPAKRKASDGTTVYKEVKIQTLNRRPATGILKRGVLIEPHLYLAFAHPQDAEKAARQHICLCRNEDLLLPEELLTLSAQEWQQVPGFELRWDEEDARGFKVGFNRFQQAAPMYGRLVSVGDPIRKSEAV
jgi:hypothetical protein